LTEGTPFESRYLEVRGDSMKGDDERNWAPVALVRGNPTRWQIRNDDSCSKLRGTKGEQFAQETGYSPEDEAIEIMAVGPYPDDS
jgi:hypothetical protein